ncbi:hypothetical protein [Natrinema ejinorense]|uniref:Uncharacterized protein n=1 Tax=Natrinema ejinorense TaxID=373386 RepID=A0A2A5QZ68_9EURY|nr:hypothetical protein [Natrinema ejinorense]PCR92121.1 hypothetical protein CP557_17265 [Natrinema ejinorense]
MSDSPDVQLNSTENGQRMATLIGIGAGILDVPAFAYLGLLLFDDLVFGAFVGLLVGLGTYLFLPVAMADDGTHTSEETPPMDTSHPLRRFHRAAAGLALMPAGILLFAWGFVSQTLLLGVLATSVIAAVIYVSLAVLLPRRLA